MYGEKKDAADNVFAFPYNKKGKEVPFDGDVFITERIDEEANRLLEEKETLVKETIKKYSLSKTLKVIKKTSGVLAAILFAILFRSSVESSLAIVYITVPYLFYIATGCAVIAAALYILEKKRVRELLASEDYQEIERQASAVGYRAKTAFGIPDDAFDIDILSYRYTVRNGKKKRKSYYYARFINFAACVYVKDRHFCIADAAQVYAIPLSSIRGITPAKWRASFMNWNKEERFNSEKYKPYKVMKNQFQTYTAPYSILSVDDEKGAFEIFIPNYDIEEVQRLLERSHEPVI